VANKAGNSFTGGFFGCLGVLAAIVVVLFALMVFGVRSGGAATPREASVTAAQP
jgi:hypothetical protein